MGDDLDRRARRRAIAAAVILATGVLVVVAAPVVGGDGFLPSTLVSSTWAELTPNGEPTTKYAFTVTGEPLKVTAARATRVSPTVMRLDDDFVNLIASDPRWIAATVALVVIPLWFLWWRRAAMGFARGIGVLASAGATAALVALTWPAPAFCAAHVLVAAPVAYFAAFLVAPPHQEAS